MGRETARVLALAALMLVVGAIQAQGNAGVTGSVARRCAAFEVGDIAVSAVRTNQRCAHARSVIRRLLRHGIDGIPGAHASRRGWRCRKKGSLRRCRKARAGRLHRSRKLSFRAKPKPEPVKPNNGPPPPPAPPPLPPPAPQVCLDLWNNFEAVPPSPNLGIHFYGDAIHNVRRAWVSLVTDPQSGQRCAVIMVVAITDIEFGTDGELSEPGPMAPWGVMTSSSVPWFHRYEAQAAAPAKANAALDAAGRLTPLF
jgi:hypothetical protein